MSNAFHLFIILILSNHSPKIIEMIKTDRWIWKTFDDPHDFISRHQPSSKIHQIFSDHKYSNEWAVCHRVQEAPWPFPVRANKKPIDASAVAWNVAVIDFHADPRLFFL